MFGKVQLMVAVLLVSATPALADSCGSPPIAPAMPSPAEITAKPAAAAAAAKHNAFLDVTSWQRDLKNYRDCLDAANNADKAQISAVQQSSDKNAGDKVADLAADISKNNDTLDQTVDTETRVVNDFSALSSAYCSRSDVDKSTCPKH